MKKVYTYLITTLCAFPAYSQYYLRGEVKDEKNGLLSNARIFVYSAKSFYYSGSTGNFGIPLKILYDSLTISLEGYESKSIRVKADEWQVIVLKMTVDAANQNKNKLISVTKNLNQTSTNKWFAGDETYFQLIENEFVTAIDFPITGFSLSVNKASYSNVRRFLKMGSHVPPDAVRTEELINYFNLHYRAPEKDKVFNIETQLTSCPWNNLQQLLYLNVSAQKLNFDKVAPGNFVFLIDVSGSMDMPNRLPLIKAAFQLFVKNLRPIDTISIVTYGGYVEIWLPPTSGKEQEKILESIEGLEAGGDTPGESAIRVAYQVAQNSFIKGGNNRIILATDGDFNVGETSEKALDELITKQKQTGVYLTCLGVGMGNFKDSKLQTLAKKGNGNYAYLDDINEAERVLVTELTKTFYSVADDVFINVTFNPAVVQQYRLIGFDNKKDALSDNSSSLEGGEIGSGSSTMAIFEIIPVKQNVAAPADQRDIAWVDLKYQKHTDTTHRSMQYQVLNNYAPIDSIDREYKFAAAVTMFGLKLKDSKFISKKDWLFIKNFSKQSVLPGNYLQQEYLNLVIKAQKIYDNKKRWGSN